MLRCLWLLPCSCCLELCGAPPRQHSHHYGQRYRPPFQPTLPGGLVHHVAVSSTAVHLAGRRRHREGGGTSRVT
jgi:hypothetical protein